MLSLRLQLSRIALAASLLLVQIAAAWDENSSTSELENRAAAIEAERAQLARTTLTSGVGSIGFRTASSETSNHPEWIEIDLGKPQPIDQIILVPALRRHAEGVDADAFPLEFRLLAGTGVGPEAQGTEIASVNTNDQLIPRIAPLVVSCGGITASWIRLEVTQLSPRGFDGKFELQLSEILVFNGNRNIAQQRPIRFSSSGSSGGARQPRFLTDGFMPYIMDAAGSDSSPAFLSPMPKSPDAKFSLTLDLGKVAPVDRIHLHAIEISDNIPQADPPNLGVPRHMTVEAALTPDFADATQLFEFRMNEVYDAGPIIMRLFAPTDARYLRFNILEANQTPWGYGRSVVRLGFAEIEAFAKGENVALGQNFTQTAATPPHALIRPLSTLTDGRNLYGKILPVRDWLNQLAKRHDLKRELPAIQALLQQRYLAQQQTLRNLQWLAGILILGILIALVIAKLLRQRAVFQARERIAADLHDELGANLHAISLIGELAQEAEDNPARLRKLLDRLSGATSRTIEAARYCTNLLESKPLGDDLTEDLQRSSARILADLEHDLKVEGEEHLRNLDPKKRLDLFLFYKESLTNIIRHSGATHVTTQLTGDPSEIHLTISDNGIGIAQETVPSSLKRRARLLGARVTAKPGPDGGLQISLTVRKHQPWPFSLL